MYSLEKYFFVSSVHFYIRFLLWSWMNSLYIFDIDFLLNIPSANIFSDSVVSLFVLLIFFSMCKNFLAWCSNFLFCFCFLYLRRQINLPNPEILLRPILKVCCLFSSGRFYGSDIKFKPFTHLSLFLYIVLQSDPVLFLCI